MRRATERHAVIELEQEVAEILIVPSTIEGLLVWTAAELQAERDFLWYASCGPGSFVRRCPPSLN